MKERLRWKRIGPNRYEARVGPGPLDRFDVYYLPEGLHGRVVGRWALTLPGQREPAATYRQLQNAKNAAAHGLPL